MRLIASLAYWFPRLLVLGLLVACATKSDDGITRCAGDRTCPENFVCGEDGNCYLAGTVPRGVDAASGRDAGGGGSSGGKGGAGGLGGKGGAGDGAGGEGGSPVDAPGETGAMMADTGGSDRAPPPANCAEFANAWCSKKASCEPLDLPFASEGDCREGMARYCTDTFLNQPDSGWTPAAAGICVAEMQRPGCFEWFGLSASRKCDPRGKRAGGAGAYSWVQCESAASYWRGGVCGYCYESAAAGQPCGDDAVCPAGHLCSQLKRCRPASLNGQPCGDDSPCHPAFMCTAGVCRPPGLADAVCKTDADCDSSLALRCNVPLGRCRKAIAGSIWNRGNADGTINACIAGTTPQSDGGCLPLAIEGAACVASGNGPSCQLPGICVAGTCKVPKVVDCPAVRPTAGYPAGTDPWCNLNPERPQYCPPRGDLGWTCWPAGTACGTVTHCGDQLAACNQANLAFDCGRLQCIENPCKDPAFPTHCSDTSDAAITGCWSPGTRCSTTTNCAGKPVACNAENTSPDCTLERCVPACEAPVGASTCNTCASKRCCASYGACQGDPMCGTRSGNNWTALQACAQKFCAAECASTPIAPPPPR